MPTTTKDVKHSPAFALQECHSSHRILEIFTSQGTHRMLTDQPKVYLPCVGRIPLNQPMTMPFNPAISPSLAAISKYP